MKAQIIIDLGYGDSGKGITTDYLCNKAIEKKEKPIVIRFSGGPQAGHNVEVNDKNHIHSSFGSGTFRHNVPSYFTEHTLIYPPNLLEEQKILKHKGITPKLIIHPLAKLILPLDIIRNRCSVIDTKNGTCGLGIGSAMKRNEGPHKFYALDLLYPKILAQKLRALYSSSQQYLISEYIKAVKSINFKIDTYNYLWRYDNLIFEGSQGVMLDMDHGVFPYVTYANTTSKNAFNTIEKLNIYDIPISVSIYYVTRCYSTLHGGNPNFRKKNLKLINNKKETNIFNEYQGFFKIGEINYTRLNYALDIDFLYSQYKGSLIRNLVVTCMDQRPDFTFKHSLLKTSFKDIYHSYSADSKDFEILY